MIGFFNGEFISVEQRVLPIDERGHNFGDGVYEVIRVYNGTPFLMKEHLLRLQKSAEAIRLQMPYTLPELEQLIQQGVEKSGLEDVEVYLQITRGIATRLHAFPDVPPSLAMTFRPAKPLSEEKRQKGIAVTLMEDERWAKCYIKSLNLLPNVLAKQAATEAGFYEAVLVKDGYVTEGSSSNAFVIKDGTIYTHPANKSILHGITRAAVLELAQQLDIPVLEERFTADFFLAGDEVFMTSTSLEVMPVHTIDQQAVANGNPGPLTKKLQAAFHELYAPRV